MRFVFSAGAVYAVATIVRWIVAATLWDLPLVRTPKLDSAEFLSWARRLASGDWTWPAVAAHGPGYPYVLAALLTVGEGSLKAAIALQALVGAGTAVLIALCARRLFGVRAGLFAGLIYAVYGPAAYIDTAILAEGLLLFLLALALWALAADPPAMRDSLIAGAAFGAAALVRPTALIIAMACLVWLLWKRGPRLAGAFVVAGAVVLAPALAKSWSASGAFSIQGYGGLNAYIGNSPEHDGRPTFRLGAGWDALNSEAARAGIRDAAAQDRYYLAKVWKEVRAEPSAYVRLLASKVFWLVQSEEVRDSHSYYFFTDRSQFLRILPRWWLLFPLALTGLFGAVRGSVNSRAVPGTDNALSVPGTALVGAAASVVLLVVGFRYRMPVVLVLTVFAGAGLDGLVSAVASRQTRDLAIAGVVMAASLLLTLTLRDPRNTNIAEEWALTGSALVTEHRLDEADAAYRQALALDPESGLAWDGFGLTLFNRGRLSEARSAFERAMAIDRDSSRAIYHLAAVEEQEGNLAQAAAGYERALALSPFDAEITDHLAGARRELATDLGMSGRTREARDAMRRVVELTPRDGEAWLDLCLLSLDLSDVDSARNALQRARELGADPARVKFAEDALAKVR